ncbi:hypothetical protein RDI58_013130 [Solanum bulbocastanum]|uniref:Uncharacterized protein n=1 Tax=Solanum bulbocastanum TaxID=147425 RepID=A0AAN8TPL6_SOLBU
MYPEISISSTCGSTTFKFTKCYTTYSIICMEHIYKKIPNYLNQRPDNMKAAMYSTSDPITCGFAKKWWRDYHSNIAIEL